MKHRFTLWEMCVLLSLGLTLAILLVPAMVGRVGREHGSAVCRSNQQKVTMALLQWKDDHDQCFPSEADFKGSSLFWIGGAATNALGTLDRVRPLSSYLRDPENFACPRDSGTSAFDSPKHCYTAWGTSYLWAAKDIPEVGITGMLGRKYTDPLLAASSLKIMTFEPTLCVIQHPLPKQDQWHDREPRAIASFLDGHAETVKPAPPQSEPLTKDGLDKVIREKRPYY